MLSKKLNLRGIGPRLIIRTTLFLIISLLSVSIVVYYLLSRSLRENDKNLIRNFQETYEHTYKTQGLQRLKEDLSPEFYLSIVKNDGKVVAEFLPKYLDDDFEDDEEILQISSYINEMKRENGWKTILLLSGEENHDIYQKFEFRMRKLALENDWESILPLIDNDLVEVFTKRISDDEWMIVARSSEEREENLAKIRNITFIVLIPFVLVGFIISYFLARSILSPVKELANVMAKIRNGNNVRAEIRGTGDEVDQLSAEFNSLLDRNDALIDNIKSTVDNVAHDLRTPITRFRMAAEAALLHDKNSNEALQEGLESSEQILKLLNAIMDVSEAESGTMKVRKEPVELDILLENLKDIFEYVAEDKNIKLKLKSEKGLIVSADPTRLMQAFGNLLDNSIKFGSPGTEVSIVIKKENNQALISFIDMGIGIPAGEIEKIWDRLYRGDKSRSTSGLGIGLSVVKAIISVHEGTISVDSTEGKGSVFTVTLPLCNEPERLS